MPRPMLKLRSIAIELTPRCNQHCCYCYNPWREQPSPPELTAGQICWLVDTVLAEAEIEHITLTGGEPFLRGDILDLIDHINGRGLPVAIISNAGVVDGFLARALARRNVSYVQVTLAGADGAMHDLHCGAGSFARMCDGVRALADAGMAVGGSYLCTRRNFALAGEILDRMYEMGVRAHYAFNRFNPSGHAASAVFDLLPRRSDAIEALGQSQRFADKHDVYIQCTMPIPPCMVDESQFPRIRFGACAAGGEQAEYAIDPQGRLKLCTLQKDTIGSLFEHGIGELLARRAGEKFRSMVPEFCMPCPHRDACLGGCGAAAQWVLGSADQLDPFLAQHVVEGFGTDRQECLSHVQRQTGMSVLPGGTDKNVCPMVDAWHDLVYHVLAHLHVDDRDASTIWNEQYANWSAQRLASRERLLPSLSTLLARLYDLSPQGFLLHGWPMLFDGVEGFWPALSRNFEEMVWNTDARQGLATAIVRHTEPGLADLFMTALADEWRCGFGDLHREELLRRAEAYRPFFEREVSDIARALPGLGEVSWVLSYPLLTHGRLLYGADGRPVIAVGVADEGGQLHVGGRASSRAASVRLGSGSDGASPSLSSICDRPADAAFAIAPLHPVIQGCHEFFVHLAQQRVRPGEQRATIVGRPGYAEFAGQEGTALAMGESFFASTRWEDAHRSWLLASTKYR